jgi:DNA-directed RNA polymerase specialized sigma24 family protein
MKLSEIADILEENVNTVKSRLYRSLRKLQGLLLEEAEKGGTAYGA